MTFDYSKIFKKLNFNLTKIHLGSPGTEYTAKSILNKINGERSVMCFQRDPNGKYIDYFCDNQLTVRIFTNGRAELVSNINNTVSPLNIIKLLGSEITNIN